MTSPSVPDTERTILEIIQTLRDNPEKYAAFRRALNEAGTDEAERVRTLLHFATSEQELAALVPASLRRGEGEPEALMAITTVTVTTVFVACSAY
jgi:hypothetical protein